MTFSIMRVILINIQIRVIQVINTLNRYDMNINDLQIISPLEPGVLHSSKLAQDLLSIISLRTLKSEAAQTEAKPGMS